MSYFNFANHYDQLTANVNYKARAEYFCDIIDKYTVKKPEKLLDLACGTGSLSVELAKLGYRVIGVDASSEMLEQASSKIYDYKIKLLQQTMQDLILENKVDGVICALDSINHLPNLAELTKTFKKVGEALNFGGVFVFDVNTLYKHKEILANNCYIYETPDVFCCWQNSYNEDDFSVDISLDFFVVTEDGRYEREYEDFQESFFSHETIKKSITEAGMELIEVFAEDSFDYAKQDEQRLIYIAKNNNGVKG